MYIDFDRLKDKGYSVIPTSNGVEIRGTRELNLSGFDPIFKQTNLTDRQIDLMVSEFAEKLEVQTLMNDLA
jgi:hypothetical protein